LACCVLDDGSDGRSSVTATLHRLIDGEMENFTQHIVKCQCHHPDNFPLIVEEGMRLPVLSVDLEKRFRQNDEGNWLVRGDEP
jgi:hypothetical protein